MRLTLLGLIFVLLLTLGNALLYRQNVSTVSSRDFDPIQITQPHATKYEWDYFIARELGAIGLTLIVFVSIGNLRNRRRRQAAHPAFDDRIANRR